jgi:hypothetical protein
MHACLKQLQLSNSMLVELFECNGERIQLAVVALHVAFQFRKLETVRFRPVAARLYRGYLSSGSSP